MPSSVTSKVTEADAMPGELTMEQAIRLHEDSIHAFFRVLVVFFVVIPVLGPLVRPVTHLQRWCCVAVYYSTAVQ